MKGPGVTCRDGVAVLADYVDGALSASRRRAVDAHVAGCPRCQRFLTSYVATPRLVREATGERMPDTLRRRLRDRLRGR